LFTDQRSAIFANTRWGIKTHQDIFITTSTILDRFW